MICKNCGKEIANNAKFCGYCGERVESASININSDYSWINQTKPKNVPDEEEFKPLSGLNNYVEEQSVDQELSNPVNKFDEEEFKPFQNFTDNTNDDIDDFEEFKPFTDLDTDEKEEAIKVNSADEFNFADRDDNFKPFQSSTISNSTLDYESKDDIKSFDYSNINSDGQTIESINNYKGVKDYQTISNGFRIEEENKINDEELKQSVFNAEVSEPLSEIEAKQSNLDETIKVEPNMIKDNFEIDKLEEKIEEDKNPANNKSNNCAKALIVMLVLIILGLAGYIVYDKFINNGVETHIDETNKESNEVKENSMTEAEALAIVQGKYSSIYGETFNTMYYNLITNGDLTPLQTLFTQNAIDKLKINTTYNTGLFGTTNQTIRQLSIISYNDNYIVAVGKNDTDLNEYYISFKNINNTWYIDMFE